MRATVLFLLILGKVVAEKWLDNFVSYYEITNNADLLSRSRRSVSEMEADGGSISYPIHAFNQTYVLILNKDNSIFSHKDEVEVEDADGKVVTIKTPLVVNGFVDGYPDSYVHGSLINNRFEGEIILIPGVESLIMENAEKFDLNHPVKQSVVYRSSDITLDAHKSDNLLNRKRRSTDSGEGRDYSICGLSHDDVRMAMSENQHSAGNFLPRDRHDRNGEGSIYSAAANLPNNRMKRAAINSDTRQPGLLSESSILNKPKICGLFMQVDHLLYDKYFKQANSEHDAVANIIAYLGFVAQKANIIYNSTEFYTRDGHIGPYRNIHLAIMRTKIYRTESEFARTFDVKPNEEIKHLDATNFLNLVSRANNDKYCASYVFTLRDFSSGILGLAWIGYPDVNQRGGVCDQYGATRTGRQSLNTGIVTMLNYGQQVNRLVSAITFAHELGHNFGAQHDNTPVEPSRDPDKKCFPGGSQGNFIMYSSATSGLKPNNEKFSECSRDLIARNVNAIFKNQVSKINCFRESDEPFCGNSVVDPGEECDCGFRDDCGIDANCCGAADDPQFRCRFKPIGGRKAKCSLSNGVCCNVDYCDYIPKSELYVCRQADECNNIAHCNGTSATCPRAIPKEDGKLCANNTKICLAGDCAVSSCELISEGQSQGSSNGEKFTGCQSVRPGGQSKYNRTELCFLSCRTPSTGVCHNSLDAASREFDPDFSHFLAYYSGKQPIQLQAGSPCDNDRGYCDVFRRCRSVNAEGPLSRLKDMLFSDKTILTLQAWVEKYWWAVALFGVGMIAFMIAFVKACSVHTPSDNRNLPPARSLTDTIRRTKPVVYLVNRGGPAHGRGRGHRRMVPAHVEGESSRVAPRSAQPSAPPLPPNVRPPSGSSRPPTYQETFT